MATNMRRGRRRHGVGRLAGGKDPASAATRRLRPALESGSSQRARCQQPGVGRTNAAMNDRESVASKLGE